MPRTTPTTLGAPSGPTGTIGTVALSDPLTFGPELDYSDHFGSLLLGEASSALVVVDGVALERWEVSGPTANLSWSIPLGSWPRAASADIVPGTYLLALGYGGTTSIP